MTNDVIFDFLKNNYLLVIFLIFSTVRMIPNEWAGFWKYNNNKQADGRAPRITILYFLLYNLINSVLSSFLIPVLGAFGFKQTITVIILGVVVFNIFSLQQISAPAVTLIGIGIVSLYLDRLIETGKHIEFFKFVIWDKDK